MKTRMRTVTTLMKRFIKKHQCQNSFDIKAPLSNEFTTEETSKIAPMHLIYISCVRLRMLIMISCIESEKTPVQSTLTITSQQQL